MYTRHLDKKGNVLSGLHERDKVYKINLSKK